MPKARTDVSDVDPRDEFEFTVTVRKLGSRTRKFVSGLIPEDLVINQQKAYLYALALKKIYDRPETPKKILMELTRSRILPE